VRANDDAKVPVAQYHIYRRHFVFFRMSRHAFLEINPEVTAEGLEKLIGASSLDHAYFYVVEWMCRSELLVGRKEAPRHPEIPKLSIVSGSHSLSASQAIDRTDRRRRNVTYLPIRSYEDHRTKSARDDYFSSKSTVSRRV
jgi:hypothetical protein